MTREEFIVDLILYYKNNPRGVDEEGACAYRTASGDKCAIGRYIYDDKYDSSFEGCRIYRLLENHSNILPSKIVNLGTHFLQSMQTLYDIHDHWEESDNSKDVLLSIEGISFLNLIVKNYNLDKDKIFSSLQQSQYEVLSSNK